LITVTGKEPTTSKNDPAAKFYLRGGVPLEDLGLLMNGDEVVVALDGEPYLETPVKSIAPAKLLPDQPEQRVVTCSFFINAVKKINVIEGLVELDFILYLSWVDPALAGVPVDQRPPYEGEGRCWNPEIEVNNNVNLVTLWSVFPPPYQGVEEGKVVFGARYRGSISNQMELHNFPLDSDSVHINVGPKNLTVDQCTLRIDPAKHRTSALDEKLDRPGDRIKSMTLSEWGVDVPFVRRGLSGPTGSGNYYCNVEFVFIVHRNFMYYVWKVMLIMIFIIISSWMPFFQKPSDFASRFGQGLTLLLAAVAFLFVVNDALPKVSYLTVLDKLLLSAFGAIFFVLLESFVVFNLDKNGKTSLAESIDGAARVLYPIVFITCVMIFLRQAVSRRYALVTNPEAQMALAIGSSDSGLKPLPATDENEDEDKQAEEGGGGGGSSQKAKPKARRGTALEVMSGSTSAAQRQRLQSLTTKAKDDDDIGAASEEQVGDLNL
jgi:hypothetical protein